MPSIIATDLPRQSPVPMTLVDEAGGKVTVELYLDDLERLVTLARAGVDPDKAELALRAAGDSVASALTQVERIQKSAQAALDALHSAEETILG